MKMHRNSVQNLTQALFVKTAKHLDDVFCRYSAASQCLLKVFNSTTDDKTKEVPKSFGTIKLILDDEKFENMKLLI